MDTGIAAQVYSLAAPGMACLVGGVIFGWRGPLAGLLTFLGLAAVVIMAGGFIFGW